MVLAGELHRLQHALEAQFLDALGGEVEVFEAPAHLLARQRLVAELLLRGANGLHAEHRVDDAAVVEHLSEVVLGGRLALGDDELLQVLVHLELAGRMLKHQRLVAGRLIAGGRHVRLRTRPPHADHLVARIGDGGGFLDGGGVHHAPAPQQHVVRPVLADRQPLRLLLDARMRDGNGLELEAILLGTRLERRDRLLAVGAVVIDEADLLALQLVEAAELLGDVLDGDVRRRPVAADGDEVPGEHACRPGSPSGRSRASGAESCRPAPSRSARR